MEQSNLLKAQITFALDVARLIALAASKGFFVTFGEAWRTKEQAEIYHKAGTGILNSLHCQRLAIDLNLFDKEGKYLTKSEQYQELGELWEKLSPENRWGGKFDKPDGNHFERRVPQ